MKLQKNHGSGKIQSKPELIKSKFTSQFDSLDTIADEA